jgi:hypothetical protein
MNTTSTNRRVRELISSVRNNKLVPRPDFQRRLVWNNKDKSAFLKTVLMNFPFPEIYVAAGKVDVETGEGTELLVDGQQRIMTLYQYFIGSTDLVLSSDVPPYAKLSKEEKEAFLQYNVVVRDLGHVDIERIRNVFQRINATAYSLNAMEIHNSRYEGAFKDFIEEYAQRPFFEMNRVFSPSEIRRMQDMRFVGILVSTILSTYFNRDDELEEFLNRYNDDFPLRTDTERELDFILEFIDKMLMPSNSRIWKKADLFTIIVELHAAIYKRKLDINPNDISTASKAFYELVDDPEKRSRQESDQYQYYNSTLQATNDRSSRITRGKIIRNVIEKTINE